MEDAASIGASFSDYQGSAALGGGSFGPITVDTKPLDQLAAYTFFANKSKWEQKQKETDAKVQQLADLSTISLNDLRGKDKEEATKRFSDLIKKASIYARKVANTPQERIQNELDWQTEYGGFKNIYNSGKGRAVSYAAQRSAILADNLSASVKEEKLKLLDESFDKTDIGTPISAVPNFQIKTFDVPKPVASEFNSVTIGANDIFKVKGSYYDPSRNGAVSDGVLFNLNKIPKKGTPEYNSLSELEKQEADVQSRVDNPASGWVDAVPSLNSVLTKKDYVNPDGSFNYAKFEDENALNSVVMKPYNAIKKLSDYSKEKFEQAKNGMFSDNGVSVKLPDNVNPQNFRAGLVDFTKGVNATQLLNAGSFAQYEGDKFTKDITHTGEENDLLKARLIQQGENYRARLNESGANTRAMYPYLYAKKGTDKQDTEDIANANSVLSEVSSILNNGAKSVGKQSLTDVFMGGNNAPFEISDPTILKEFATINKDGTSAQPPTQVKYDKKKDELIMIYGKKADGTDDPEPDIQKINAQTYLTMKVKQKFPNKEIGAINSIISRIFNKEGNLLKIADIYDKQNNVQTDNSQSPQTQPTAPLTDAQKFLNSLNK